MPNVQYRRGDIFTSISFPKLGAGNGKLSWGEVGPLMAQYLGQTDINVYIYIAQGDQEFFVEEQITALHSTSGGSQRCST